VLGLTLKPKYIPVLYQERKATTFNNKKAIFEYVSSAVIAEGERNAAVGVIVQYLEEQNKDEAEILAFARNVNAANFRPRCRDRELVRMVKGWYGRYDEHRCLSPGYMQNNLSSLKYEHEHIKMVSKQQTVRIAASIVKRYAKELGGNDLYILFVVRRYGAMGVSQLIDQVHLARRTVFNIVKRLKSIGVLIEERGLVRMHVDRLY